VISPPHQLGLRSLYHHDSVTRATFVTPDVPHEGEVVIKETEAFIGNCSP